jgi:hypothetical protein
MEAASDFDHSSESIFFRRALPQQAADTGILCSDFFSCLIDFKVDFPQTLDMLPYVTGVAPRRPFELYGVSNHYGTMSGGHYTAFCKNVYSQRSEHA